MTGSMLRVEYSEYQAGFAVLMTWTLSKGMQWW